MSAKTAIVTGAGRGIGRATCITLARAGYHIVAAARTANQLDETRQLVLDAGAQCTAAPCDLADPTQIQALIETAAQSAGRIDVLINNAGLAPKASIADMDPQAFTQMMRVNCDAVFFACQAVWPIMQNQGGGAIVNVSSLASFDPFPGFAAYGASKAWVTLFTKAAADEGRPHNIRVFAVAPGAVETNMLRSAFPDFPADQSLTPQNVADLIQTLLNPACTHATGSTIPCRK